MSFVIKFKGFSLVFVIVNLDAKIEKKLDSAKKHQQFFLFALQFAHHCIDICAMAVCSFRSKMLVVSYVICLSIVNWMMQRYDIMICRAMDYS